jgi:hypothetical protein
MFIFTIFISFIKHFNLFIICQIIFKEKIYSSEIEIYYHIQYINLNRFYFY